MARDTDSPGAATRTRELWLGLWPLALSLVLLAPLRHSGQLLSRDLVFVPHEPLTDASLGLGGTAPRSVPLDAVVAVIGTVVDGGVLGRVVLLLSLAAAGWGVLRLTSGLGPTGRLAASGFAVWNPFVIERLALGQWALVLAYAALPWVVLAAATHRRTGSRRAGASTVLWSALASLTPTGGLLALAGTVAGGASRRLRSWALVAVVGVLQLPWIVPSVVGGASRTSDPAGVAVFAPGSDASGHPALALLGLGGIWDGLSVPDSRHTWLAVAAIVVVAISAVLGVRRWWDVAPDLAPRLAALGLVGLLLALALTSGPGQDVLRHAVSSVPGAGPQWCRRHGRCVARCWSASGCSAGAGPACRGWFQDLSCLCGRRPWLAALTREHQVLRMELSKSGRGASYLGACPGDLAGVMTVEEAQLQVTISFGEKHRLRVTLEGGSQQGCRCG